MTIQTTYSQARSNLAKLFDRVTADREVVIIHRRNGDDVALIAADELSGLLETAHLLRSPANARRLLTALARVPEQTIPPQTIAELRREVLDARNQPARKETADELLQKIDAYLYRTEIRAKIKKLT
ncbi:MAG: type II toxin-antitoxin system Phd/YefM family antitoxin, partial [Chloroflexi bacterium]|nr:type II toxin-antitoxin system Phd/YefM family antitoxin [Chloroflexota bacterium]